MEHASVSILAAIGPFPRIAVRLAAVTWATLLALGWTTSPVLASTQYSVSFDLVDAATNASEHADLTFDVDDTLHTGAGGFMGYQVTSLSGMQDGNPLSLVAPGLAGFNGISNDNLFSGSANYFSAGGLGYQENGGELYQLFFSSADNQLEGCWSYPTPCVPLKVIHFQSAVTPLPPTLALFVTCLAGLGLIAAYRRVTSRVTAATAHS